MRITVGELRSTIQEAIKNGPGIRLIRVGGLSPIWQKKGTAPENRGVWAFIWPYSEMFLLGSTGPEGAHPGEGKSRYDKLQREGWKRFVHTGTLYTRFQVPNSVNVGGWYRTDGPTLAAYMTKHFANMTRDTWRSPNSWGGKGSGLPFKANPWSLYSKDEFEVFVPRPDERGF